MKQLEKDSNMKYNILFILITIMTTSQVFSQRVEITPMFGYQFGGAVDETEQEEGVFDYKDALGLNGSGYAGLIIDIRLGQRTLLEIAWDRQPTQMNFHEGNGEAQEIVASTDINLDYLYAGLIYDWSQTFFRPFVGGTVGIIRLDPKEDLKTEIHYFLAPVVGFKTFASKNFAIRAQVRFIVSNMPEKVLFEDAQGEGFHHEKETFMTQFQLGLGLVIGL